MSRFRKLLEQQLPIAEAFVARGEELLSEQRARIAAREQRGKRSVEAENLLKLMESSQTLHIEHVVLLRRDLERDDYSPPSPYQPPKTDPPPRRDPR